jgi:ABC-type transporter Mla subunit MlaD
MELISEESEKIHRMTKQQREAFQSSIIAASGAIQSVSEDLSKLTGKGSLLSSVVDNLRETTENFGEIGKSIEELSKNISREAAEQKNTIGEFNSITAASIQLTKTHNLELNEALKDNRKMLAEVGENLADMARALVKAVG